MSRVVVRQHSLPELLWWAERLANRTDGTAFEREFCADMAKRSRWRRWAPTDKQVRTLRSIVTARLEGVEVIDTAA